MAKHLSLKRQQQHCYVIVLGGGEGCYRVKWGEILLSVILQNIETAFVYHTVVVDIIGK